MKQKIVITIGLFFIFKTMSQSDDSVLTAINLKLKQFAKENKIKSVSVGIVKNGELFSTINVGEIAQNDTTKVSDSSVFLTCSISKLFTTMAIMKLVEENKINIHLKLLNYIPEFKMKSPAFAEITLEQMLTHTSGLPNIFKRNWINTSNDSMALTLFANKLKNEKLAFNPNVKLSAKTYSNTAFNILGLVVERVSGMSFANYIQQNILQPLAMNNSTFFLEKIPKNKLVLPQQKNIFGVVYNYNYYANNIYDKPCGNLHSTVLDMCKFIQYHLNLHNEKNTDNAIISDSTLKKMWTSHKAIEGFKTSVGLGWWIYPTKKYGNNYFHVGTDPGFSCTLNIFPEKNIGLVILTNARYAMEPVMNELPYDLMQLLVP